MNAHLVLILTQLFLIFSYTVHAQMVSVSGYVKNQLTGEAIKDATVFESNSGIGTITNNDGFYRLLLIQEQQKLEISSPDYIPYASTFKLVTDTVIIVELIPRHLSNFESNAENDFLVESVASTNKQKEDAPKRK